MTTPQNKGQEELREKLEALDIDFGYAVGNLGEDCKDGTVDTLMRLFNQELEARVKEARADELTKAWAECSADAGEVHKYALDRLQELSQPKEEK